MSQFVSIPVPKRRALTNTLELRLRRAKGAAFQDFFAAFMSAIHRDNYVPASSAYSQGDISCDGVLVSPLTIFACYGPVDGGTGQTPPSIRKAVAKVTSDFEGAVAHWPDLKGWKFVTNYVEGTPPALSQEVLRLAGLHPDREVKQFGKAEFEREIFRLHPDEIELLLGPDATDADFRGLEIRDVQELIAGIVQDDDEEVIANDEVLKEISPGKLDFNKLPKAYRDKLRQGFANAPVVATYLLDHPDPTLDSRIATIFRSRYLDLVSQGLSPGRIMDQLYAFALGERGYTVPVDVAIYSLLSHLFEKCTIFEDVPEEVLE